MFRVVDVPQINAKNFFKKYKNKAFSHQKDLHSTVLSLFEWIEVLLS